VTALIFPPKGPHQGIYPQINSELPFLTIKR